jgi:CBS domain-containing protein
VELSTKITLGEKMHQAVEVMRRNVEFCTPETVTPDVKYLIKRYNYEDLLVVNNMRDFRIVGVIHASSVTDEALRSYSHPFEMKALNFMDNVPPSVGKNATIDDCLRVMSESDLSVLPVLDDSGKCCGIVKRDDLLNFKS